MFSMKRKQLSLDSLERCQKTTLETEEGEKAKILGCLPLQTKPQGNQMNH